MFGFKKLLPALNNADALKGFRAFIIKLGFVINLAMITQVLSVKEFTINYLYAFFVLLAVVLVLILPFFISKRIRTLSSTPM